MPTYQYRCTSCDTELEAFQKFTDDALTDCPECHGNLRKVFNAVGVVFKGSGFYATDNRPKAKTGKSGSSEKGEPKPAAESGSKSDAKPKSDQKPKSDHKQKSDHKHANSDAKSNSSTGTSSAA